ncbi:MAG: protein translocase subunit SecF [Candidatus Gracilibacteria bacterium]|nr:protein translocase subunit SecF [Candidatus Gracilibacteria bacterium]
MNIIRYKWFWITLSSLFVGASILAYATFGLRLSADFTEGSLYEVQFDLPTNEAVVEAELTESEATEATDSDAVTNLTVVTQERLREVIAAYVPAEGIDPIGSVEIKKSGEGHFTIRLRRLEPAASDAFLAYINSEAGSYELTQSRDVSPTFAQTFRDRALLALLVTTLMIILYITFAFRKVSRGIKSWKLGFAAIVALAHDIIIIVGLFSLLGYYYQVEVDALFITALLSVMGFSVNDTIVVFDRLRENLFIQERGESFDKVANKSLNQTLARSINTSFSTFIVLSSLLILGAQELYYFVLALILGVAVGTYSSIFLATPLLTIVRNQKD